MERGSRDGNSAAPRRWDREERECGSKERGDGSIYKEKVGAIRNDEQREAVVNKYTAASVAVAGEWYGWHLEWCLFSLRAVIIRGGSTQRALYHHIIPRDSRHHH